MRNPFLSVGMVAGLAAPALGAVAGGSHVQFAGTTDEGAVVAAASQVASGIGLAYAGTGFRGLLTVHGTLVDHAGVRVEALTWGSTGYGLTQVSIGGQTVVARPVTASNGSASDAVLLQQTFTLATRTATYLVGPVGVSAFTQPSGTLTGTLGLGLASNAAGVDAAATVVARGTMGASVVSGTSVVTVTAVLDFYDASLGADLDATFTCPPGQVCVALAPIAGQSAVTFGPARILALLTATDGVNTWVRVLADAARTAYTAVLISQS